MRREKLFGFHFGHPSWNAPGRSLVSAGTWMWQCLALALKNPITCLFYGKSRPQQPSEVCGPLRTGEFGYFVFPFLWCLTGNEEGPWKEPWTCCVQAGREALPCWCPEVFSSKDKKNGLGLLEDGLAVPEMGQMHSLGADPVTGGQRWTLTEHQCTGQWGGTAPWASSLLFRGFWIDLWGQAHLLHVCTPDPGFLELSCVIQTLSCCCSHVTAQIYRGPEEPWGHT